jgi:hypothetical protein
VTYKKGFGLDDWVYTGNYSAIADLHTLQFTVTYALGFSAFTRRIQATDLQQSHCHFKSHINFFSQPNSLLAVSFQSS